MEHLDRLTYVGSARALLLAGGCLLGACGGGAAAAESTLPSSGSPPAASAPTASPPVHERGDQRASAHMGGAGGDLTLGNGARLEIPPGALAADTEVLFSVAEQSNALRNRDDEKTVGAALVVAPARASANGARFVLELPYTSLPEGFSEADLALAFERQDEDAAAFRGGAMRTRWDHTTARATPEHRLRAELDALPGMRVQFVVSR